MIRVTNLLKCYGEFSALSGISFGAKKGEILALLGPNGAGKTTTMKIMTGFLSASSGAVEIDGEEMNEENCISLQKKIGYLPENAPLIPDLSVLEHLEFAAEVHGLSDGEKRKAIKRVAESCGILDRLYFDVSELSKGYRQRLGLAQALIHDPEILILDEPTTGLDPNQIVEIRSLITKIGREKTVILSTHIMQEVEAIANRVVLLNHGKIVAEGTPSELQQGDGRQRTVVVIGGAQKTALDVLKAIKSVEKIEKNIGKKGENTFTLFSKRDIRAEITSAILKAKLPLLELRGGAESLEEVFQELTK